MKRPTFVGLFRFSGEQSGCFDAHLKIEWTSPTVYGFRAGRKAVQCATAQTGPTTPHAMRHIYRSKTPSRDAMKAI
jgi:hypothetical protein